jgi:protein-L-isoaspartate O-methyltransferase
LAYTDQPIREGSIHISAPHIYGTILEALDLPSTKAGSTFLNLGSGTGYLTCLVTQVMGPQTIAYNVELQDEPFRHGQQAVQQWQQESMQRRHPKMEFLQGNGLVLHPSEGEACMGFDRIYVGAALELEALQPVANLLRPNGVLVCPGKFGST